jgi:hypothetical protein
VSDQVDEICFAGLEKEMNVVINLWVRRRTIPENYLAPSEIAT